MTGRLLYVGFHVGNPGILALPDLILSVEEGRLVVVPLRLEFVHPLLSRHFALQVAREPLGLLGFTEFQLDVLEFAFQIAFKIVGQTVELVGLCIEENLEPALRFDKHPVGL